MSELRLGGMSMNLGLGGWQSNGSGSSSTTIPSSSRKGGERLLEIQAGTEEAISQMSRLDENICALNVQLKLMREQMESLGRGMMRAELRQSELVDSQKRIKETIIQFDEEVKSIIEEANSPSIPSPPSETVSSNTLPKQDDLLAILDSPTLKEKLVAFAISRASEEGLVFLTAAAEFQELCDACRANEEFKIHDAFESGRKISDEFLVDNSVNQIYLEHQLVQDILEVLRIESPTLDDLDRLISLFNDAIVEVQNDLRVNILPQFQASNKKAIVSVSESSTKKFGAKRKILSGIRKRD